MDAMGGIGKKGELPWPHMTEDMKSFMNLTTEHAPHSAVVMGRKTWESLPSRHRPLKDRVNIIISTTMEQAPNGEYRVVNSLENAIKLANKLNMYKVWVMGGAQVYKTAMESDIRFEKLFITKFTHEDKECDAFFPIDTLVGKYHTVTSSPYITQDGYVYNMCEYESNEKHKKR